MTTILLITNLVCFFVFSLLEAGRAPVTHWLALSLDGLKHGLIYQLITFQFMHDGPMHLLGNMLMLFFFGRAMEEMLGRKGLLKLYLMSGTIGGLMQIAFGLVSPDRFGGSVVGASAGVFGLVAAFAMSRPNESILLFFVLPVPAKYILAFEGAWAVWGLIFPTGNIAHAAHLGGMLTGMAYIYWNLESVTSQFKLPRFFQRKERVIITPPKGMWRSAPRRSDELPSDEFISGKVDPILEKISAHGIHSLTEEERQILETARRKMSRK